ncbi:aldo/keto reductase [Streptomyces sp. CC224B]|uniref:aldo/keto reductase n=1 Tax=Streptomyces sp. CC224B TaxID=3044571 RepID=UPI0024A9F217|nr:aldo/keto reductase [Streptomyces sp. CC224B]
MSTPPPPGGTITLAGKTVSRLGLGTMRLTGPGTWGDPANRDSALSVLRQAVHPYGITHIDTADAYGPHTVEHLIRDALYPCPPGLLIATKVGMLRPGPDLWAPHGHPAYLRSAVEASLGAEWLELCHLHHIDPEVPLADQLATLHALQQEGKIGLIGLSKVTPETVRAVAKVTPVAAVRNVLHLNDRHDPVLELCRDQNIPYIPYRPLTASSLARNQGPEAALAWLLQLGPHVAPTRGTNQPHHLHELVTAAGRS